MSRKPRRSRFSVNESFTLSVHVQTSTCEDLKGQVRDISKTGCSFVLEKNETTQAIEVGDLLPLGKLLVEDKEWAFGRSVVKFKRESDSDIAFGVMFVDFMAPVETSLSKYLNLREVSGELEIDAENSSLADFLGRDGDSYDLFQKAFDYKFYLDSLKSNARWGYWLTRKPSKGVRVNLTRRRKSGRDDFIIMASNDYLGLSAHPEVVEAAKKGLDLYGFGATGSPVTTGQTEDHQLLESMIAELYNVESALLFNSGYAANLGTIGCLAGVNDLLLADFLSHASISDGMSLSKATSRLFKHNDMRHLELILKRYRDKHSGALIIAEGIFSMDGDLAPLNEIHQLAKKYNCRLMLDDAHSFGVVGEHGLGSADKFDLLGKVDLTMGTFSKICGTIGGYICGSKEIIDWLNISARSVFFSVGLPPSTVKATVKSLEIFKREPERRERLKGNIKFFVNGLRNLGFPIAEGHESAIVPLIIGDEAKLGQMYEMLYEDGVYTIPVVYPAVSKNSCRFRFTVSSEHTHADLDFVLLVIEKAIHKLNIHPGEILQGAA